VRDAFIAADAPSPGSPMHPLQGKIPVIVAIGLLALAS
jgi:hypothetical protein